MNKNINELLEKIKENLENALDSISDIKENFSSADVKEITKPNTITIEDVRKVLVEKSRAGFREEVKELLTSYGKEKLSDIDPKDYKELLDKAKDIGGANEK